MAPSRTLRNRKKQTRLEFKPLSTSPPANNTYSDAIKDRLANVSFQGARTRSRPKPKKVAATDQDGESLPTPQPTSPRDADIELPTFTSPLSSLRTSPTLPPGFVDLDQDSSSSDDDIVLPSSKRRRLSYNTAENGVSVSGLRSARTVMLQSERRKSALSTPTRQSSRPVHGVTPRLRSESLRSGQRLKSVDVSKTSSRTSRSDSLSAHVTERTPSRRSTRRVNKTLLGQPSSPLSQRMASVDIPPSPAPLSILGSAESSDDDIMATQPAVKRKAKKPTSATRDPFVVSDDEHEYTSSKGARLATRQLPKRRPEKRQNPDQFVVDNDEVEYITSDEESKKGPSPPKMRKLTPKSDGKRKSRARQEQEELEEDLKDLQDSEQEASARKSRTRGGPVTTQRDKAKEHFDLLKRRRAGERAPRVIDSDLEDEYHEDDGIDINEIGNQADRIEISSDDEGSNVPVERDQQTHEVIDEDDFVVEDEVPSGRLGRPTNDLPLQFTSFASAKPKELFPHIIEWMIKNKVSPAFNRNDEIYDLSFSRIDDQVKAQAGSRLISSAWNPTFKYAILARPGIHVAALPGLDEELIRTCDACNKSNHPARYDFTFSGKPYSKDTLEPLDDSDDEDDDDDNDGTEKIHYDEHGHVLASDRMHFYLGRFCAANAEMGHKLIHWKHQLNAQVLAYLEEQDVLSAEAIVGREKLNKKKREREAENIVDTMQETGTISELWQAFQDDLEDARLGMEGYERKGGRSKHRIGSVRVQRADGARGEWLDGGKYRNIAHRPENDSEGE